MPRIREVDSRSPNESKLSAVEVFELVGSRVWLDLEQVPEGSKDTCAAATIDGHHVA